MDYVVKRTKQRSSKDSESVLRLRGLPYGCSKEEIAQFFTGGWFSSASVINK